MIGTTVSHYKILEKLGEGGMGVVYKAHDTKLNRTVALKSLKPSVLGNEPDKVRFITEAQAAASLDHPNICTIYAIEEVEGETFIVMAYVEGESLHDKVHRGPLKIGEVLDISIQIAEGLDQAHQKGVIHRDIKCGNILLSALGLVKIMDFGLARLAGRTTITEKGVTVGTPAYMSPEQARGEKVDHRTDIWSLGVVMYEMITGRLPFRGDYQEAVFYSIVNEQPDPPTAVRTGVPMDVEKIVMKALAKNANERYQHLDELLVDLRREKKIAEQRESSQKIPARGKEYRKLSAIMVSDIVSYSKMMQQNEELAMDLLARHNQLVRDAIKKYDGTEIKAIGDAFLVDFDTVVNAVRCAIEIQETISRYNEDQPEDRKILLRIGIHVGDIIVKEDDVFGDGVNIATRIEPLAEPGGICISQEVYNLVKHKLDVQVISLGPRELKNIKDKIEIYEILVGSIAGKELGALGSRFAARSKPIARRMIASVLSIVLLATCLVAIRNWFRSPYPELGVENLQVRQATTNGKVLESVLSSDGKYIAYIYEEAGRRGISLQDVSAATAVTIVPPGPATYPMGLQFNATADHLFFWSGRSVYRVPMLGGAPERFYSTDIGGFLFAVSPDEQRLAFFDFDTTRGFNVLYVGSVKSADRRSFLVPAQGHLRGGILTWRPDGKELACGVEHDSGQSLLLVNPEDLSQKIVPSPVWKNISSIAWHPNGEDLLVAGTPMEGAGSLWLCSSRSGQVKRLSTDPSVGRSLSVNRSGTAIGMVRSVSRTSLWIVPDGDVARAQKLSVNAEGAENGVAWYSKDVLVFPAREGGQPRLGFYNILNGMTEYKSLGKRDEIEGIIGPAVSRSGQLFVPVERKQGGFALLRYDRSAESVELVAEGYIARPSISNDERTIVFDANVKGNLHVTKIALPGGSPQQLVSAFSGCPSFSPDGKNVAFYALVPVQGQKSMMRDVLVTLEISTSKQRLVTDYVIGRRQHTPISWMNDGKGIIYCGEDRGVSVLWIQPLDGSRPRPLLRFPYGEVYQFALAADGKTIALSEGSVYSDVVVLTAH